MPTTSSSALRMAIPGMAAWGAEAKAAGTVVQRQLRAAVASGPQLIVNRARAIADQLGPQFASAAQALAARGSVAGRGVVSLTENPSHPFAIGAEFGSNHGAPRGVWQPKTAPWNQLPARKPDGYFLYPAARELVVTAAVTTQTAVDTLMRGLFPE